MVKIIQKDYPWTIIIEDKISKNQNPYVSIGVGFTEKDNQATTEADQYKTSWNNFVRLEDLLKLSSNAENAYQKYKYKKSAERTANAQHNAPAQPKPAAKPVQPQPLQPATENNTYPEFDDDIPFA